MISYFNIHNKISENLQFLIIFFINKKQVVSFQIFLAFISTNKLSRNLAYSNSVDFYGYS